METKKWYQSWTLWANLLALIVLVANGVGFGAFQPAPEVAEIGGILIVVINLVLRYWRTRTAIEK
jgi:protein-S-isoprenylcysteine O-methyltransferase Ste14